jgi:hypothetical protein
MTERLTVGIGIFNNCAIKTDSLELAPYDFDELRDRMSAYESLLFNSVQGRLLSMDHKFGKMPYVIFGKCAAFIGNIALSCLSTDMTGYVHSDDFSQLVIETRDPGIIFGEELEKIGENT